MISPYLRRGMAAGLMAGLLAGIFAFFVGEPLLDRAVAMEGSATRAEHSGVAHAHEAEGHSHDGGGGAVFDRATQKVGLFFATGLSGTFLGGLFGMAFSYFRGRMALRGDWGRSLALAGAVFFGFALIPFLKYPANPPGVGDAETIGARTAAYFALAALSLLLVLAAWHAARLLRERGLNAPARQVAVGLGVAAAATLMFVLFPAPADPGEFPAGLLWNFRLSSFATQLVLWTGLGVLFGALCERANKRSEPI